jgi:hypothetical protein
LTPPPPIRRPPGRPGCTLPEPVPVVPLCRPGHEEQRTQQPAWRRAGRARRSPSAVQPRRRWEQPEQRPLAGKWRYHFPSGRNRSTLCAGTTRTADTQPSTKETFLVAGCAEPVPAIPLVVPAKWKRHKERPSPGDRPGGVERREGGPAGWWPSACTRSARRSWAEVHAAGLPAGPPR